MSELSEKTRAALRGLEANANAINATRMRADGKDLRITGVEGDPTTGLLRVYTNRTVDELSESERTQCGYCANVDLVEVKDNDGAACVIFKVK